MADNRNHDQNQPQNQNDRQRMHPDPDKPQTGQKAPGCDKDRTDKDMDDETGSEE